MFRSDGSVDAKHVLERLKDWRDRTHKLYEFIQKTLGSEFTYDRTGKHQSFEELLQRAGLSEGEVPALDILRIERPQGTLRAFVVPSGLWVIGARMEDLTCVS